MFVYIRSESSLWTVGHYAPDGHWIAASDHHDEEGAIAYTAWLNGGARPGADAAPELLAACKRAEDILAFHEGSQRVDAERGVSQPFVEVNYQDLLDMLSALRAAIAKAITTSSPYRLSESP